MRAVRIHHFGGPDEVRVEDLPTPQVGTGQALVRIRAAAVNPVDWMVREQIYNPEGADKVPMTLGQDFSGVIESLGPGSTTALRKGDAVFGEVFGSFADYAVVPVADLVKKPEGLDFAIAASLPMPGLTAWQMVVDTAGAKSGMKFLIHGVSGGVGSLAAQFARMKGARVAGTASSSSFDWLRSVGVEELIDYHRERFEEKVRDVDVVIDPLGGELQARSWSVLKKGGMLINLIGEIDADAAKQAGVRAVEFGMEYDTEDLEEIARLAASGALKSHITQVLPLDKAREALDLNQRGNSHGKIILQVA